MSPTADISSFTNEQKKLFLDAAKLGTGVQTTSGAQNFTVGQASPYTLDSLTGQAKPIDIPPPPTPYQAGDTSGLADSISKLVTEGTPQQQALEGERKTLTQSIQETLARLTGEQKKKGELEVAAGIPDLSKTLNELVNQIRQTNLSALETSTLQENRLAPTFAIQGTQARIEQLRAVKNYGLAAAAEAVQGNIALANDNVQRALDAEFRPLERVLDYQKFLYDSNRDELERADKKASDKIGILLNERSRLLEQQKADKTQIYNTATIISKYGADATTVQKVLNAQTPEEALTLASPFMVDPKAKYELESAKLDNILKGAQIKKTNYELDLLKKYGGLSPTEYANALKEEQKQIQAEKDEQERSRLQGLALGEKVTLLNTVIDSSAIDSVVGPNAFSRSQTSTWKEFFLQNLTILPAFQGSIDYFTGSGDALIGQTEQFISKEFLQNLIDVKAQGATFGALQKAEQDALTAAATYIGQRRVCSGGGRGVCPEGQSVIGYDMSEADFTEELKTIRNLTTIAYQRATGNSWTSEEQAVWDSLEETSNIFDPSF